MPGPLLEVADIFRARGAVYRAVNRGHISLGQLKVMSAVERCRTAALEGTPEDYVRGDKTPRGYRNPYLVQAMVELNMIDQMGYGIQRMYETQRKRQLRASSASCARSKRAVICSTFPRVLINTGVLSSQTLTRVWTKCISPMRRAKLAEATRL